MDQPPLDYVKIREESCTPTRDTEDSVGYDLKSPSNYLVQAGTSAVIPTGLAKRYQKDTLVDLLPNQYKLGNTP